MNEFEEEITGLPLYVTIIPITIIVAGVLLLIYKMII